MSRYLLALTVSLALTAPAGAASSAQQLTRDYAQGYRDYLEHKKMGRDADAAASYAQFLVAFRKHRLLSRTGGGGSSQGTDGGASTGGAGDTAGPANDATTTAGTIISGNQELPAAR